DLTVEAFWRIYRSHARFEALRSFGAWARRIATNVALDHLKQRRGELPLTIDVAGGGTGDPAMRVAIERAFRGLGPKLEVVARLALIEQTPQEEIAEALDIPVGTVKSRLFRAVRQLREELGDERL
ncbi:MAG: RNA polymerase sigma factor, partial [Bryobacteraceae bacterium]